MRSLGREAHHAGMVNEPGDELPREKPASLRLPYWGVALGLIAIGEAVLVVQFISAWHTYQFWRAQPCAGSGEECTPVGPAIA